MTFLFGTWPGRIIFLFGSIIILAVALGGVLGGLAITGAPRSFLVSPVACDGFSAFGGIGAISGRGEAFGLSYLEGT